MLSQNAFAPYWAALPSDELVHKALEKVDNFYKFCQETGRTDRWRRSYCYFYRANINGGQLRPVGEQGELTSIGVNFYRNYLQHISILTTQQQPYFEPKATNSDTKSQSQVILARSLLEYYLKEKRVERNLVQGVDDSLLMDEGFVRVRWDVTAGKSHGKTPMGTPAFQGDVKLSNYLPCDVIRDYTKRSYIDNTWVILRDTDVNKHDLAAKFPSLADKILINQDNLEQLQQTIFNYVESDENDNISVFTMLHDVTPAMPQGRYVEFLYNGTVLIDGPLPYRKKHVYRISPNNQTGTIFGYTTGYDLLPLQQATDILISTALTNNATHGVQNIIIPKNADLSASQLAGGLNVLEYDSKMGKPEAMQLTATSPETYKLNDLIMKFGDILSGINSIAKGMPESKDMSGAAMALLQNMAIQFNSGLQRSYAELCEDVGTGILQLLQDFASVPRVAEIVGKSNRPQMRSFTGQDLDQIARVTVDMGNPLQRTSAGKIALADAYMEKAMIKDPSQYIQVATTGRLEPVIEGEQKNLLCINEENEKLAEGAVVRALVTDDHGQHMLEHATVLANFDIRQNGDDPIVINTTAHIMEHWEMWKSMPAGMALVLKHQIPFSPAMDPMMGMGMGGGSVAPMSDPTLPVTQEANAVNMPEMPTDPLTGEQFVPQGA